MENLFTNFGLDANITKAMQEEGLITPTPIQQEVIPVAISGKDVVAQAPTGTGKTLGFLLPALAKIDREDDNVQALVLCPTRELVIQTTEVIKEITKYYEKLRSCAVYGGQNIQRQLLVLRKKPQIVIGTPGRVLDHIERRTLKLENVNFFVLDEGDEMFDMGFRNDINKIMSKISPNSQKLVFSATMPKEIKVLVDEKLHEPVYIQTKFEGNEIPKIEQKYVVIKDSQRVGALVYLIEEHNYKRSIIFCNTKHRADKLAEFLVAKKRSIMVLHGDLKQSQRTRIMQLFRNGEVEMLVATDVMARGIDVEDVEAIFNFDPPCDADYYVHRIGRTARANKNGVAYTFIGAEQTGSIPSYQKVSNNALEYLELPTLEDNTPMPRDASNRMREVRKNTTRFFVNVGQIDYLDKESMIKLVTSKTSIEAHQITDVKIRDNYGFVEVLKGCEEAFLAMQGTLIGKRELRIETATELQSGKGRTSGARPARSFDRKPREGGDRPARSFDRKPREGGDRPARTFDHKPREDGDRPARTFDSKPREYGDSPARTFDSKPREDGDRPARTYDRKPREYGDRPARTFDSKPREYGDRPARTFDSKPREYGDRPARTYDRKPREYGDRPARTFDSKPREYGDRPARTFDSKPREDGDRPARTYDRKPREYGDRPARTYDSKPREYGDRPARTFDSKPREDGDRPARTYDRKPREDGDRPARTYDRKPREDGARPARSFDRKPNGYGDRKPFEADFKPGASGIKSGNSPRFDYDKSESHEDYYPKRTYGKSSSQGRSFSTSKPKPQGYQSRGVNSGAAAQRKPRTY